MVERETEKIIAGPTVDATPTRQPRSRGTLYTIILVVLSAILYIGNFVAIVSDKTNRGGEGAFFGAGLLIGVMIFATATLAPIVMRIGRRYNKETVLFFALLILGFIVFFVLRFQLLNERWPWNPAPLRDTGQPIPTYWF